MDVVASKAYRVLPRLSRYHSLTGAVENVPRWLRLLPLRSGETVIGVYENTPDEPANAVVVTNLGLHVLRPEGSEFIGYGDMESVRVPGEKTIASSLLIVLAQGKAVEVPITGGNGRFRDAFEFARFLQGVMRGLRRTIRPGSR